ncbi:hypothetical protein BLA6863_05645 [Burkholderia lata]|uniref:Uncharacterized protein n=1 Tax=Burkholderia lata (strain ATCC 17760 / DSM 23089 / LMG 22485 / NCIMB 9086 / R18194 / 383) TaxID=482957 RepID=A0A6P2Q1X0_BURL3|nr:hypothetical protein BLA6863_05645 [Burkholderia lata]
MPANGHHSDDNRGRAGATYRARRVGGTQESAIGGRAFTRQRRRSLTALEDYPEQQTFDLRAISSLRVHDFVPVEPDVDSLTIIIGLKCAHRLRSTEDAVRTVDVMRDVDMPPRPHGFRGGCPDQRTSAPRQHQINRKEGFNAVSAPFAKSGNRNPPASPTGNPHGRVGQCPDAVSMQHRDDSRRQPDIDWIAHLRLWDRKCLHDAVRPCRGFALAGPFSPVAHWNGCTRSSR